MKVENARISRVTATEKKAEALLVLDPSNANHAAVIRQLNNFIGMPINIDLGINAERVKTEMQSISQDQMKKLYALWGDIAQSTGDTAEDVKASWKEVYRKRHALTQGYSLSSLTKDQASELIELIVLWCINNGITLSVKPTAVLTDVERYMKACIAKKICCVCGQPGEVHHHDTIGMGNNRKTVDDSDKRKMCLCRKHHSEAHQIGGETFCEKYHVEPVIFEG